MIENVVFDFGYVLAYPRTGNWFLTPESRKLVGKFDLINIALHYYRRMKVFALAQKHLNDEHLMFTEEEEIKHFIIYYQKLLNGFGIRKKVEQKAAALARDLVMNNERIGIYEDVLPELDLLKANYRVSLLSDNWPSLRRLLKDYQLEDRLSGLIISCDYGICKDNVLLFQKAIEELKLKPECSVFIDDSEKNLINAEKMGFIPILMDRKGKRDTCRYPIAHNLKEVAAIIERMNLEA